MTNYINPETLAWFGGGPFMDADCRDWVIFMTADELGLDEPKWMIDHATGELLLSRPSHVDDVPASEEVAA
jgi:hypothetical protein